MKNQKITIYEIKKRVINAPFFFSRKSMKFFHQTLKDFKVYKIDKYTFLLCAPMRDSVGNVMGETSRTFDIRTNKFI
jgi:hypothetical protein